MSVSRGAMKYGSRSNELEVVSWFYDAEVTGARGEKILAQGSVRASGEQEAKKLALEKIMRSGAKDAVITQLERGAK